MGLDHNAHETLINSENLMVSWSHFMNLIDSVKDFSFLDIFVKTRNVHFQKTALSMR
jgi:hypothetical protein